jgi:hypothetical protein
MAYTLTGFFNIEAASDDAGDVRFLGGQAEQGHLKLRAHTMHAERNWTTWHIVARPEGNYTLSVMNSNTWREAYLCVRNRDTKQLELIDDDDGRSTRWIVADAGATGVGKSYVTIQNVTSGQYITADPERSNNVGLDDKSFKDDANDSRSLWQLLQLVTADGPLATWSDEVEEPIVVADTYT